MYRLTTTVFLHSRGAVQVQLVVSNVRAIRAIIHRNVSTRRKAIVADYPRQLVPHPSLASLGVSPLPAASKLNVPARGIRAVRFRMKPAIVFFPAQRREPLYLKRLVHARSKPHVCPRLRTTRSNSLRRRRRSTRSFCNHTICSSLHKRRLCQQRRHRLGLVLRRRHFTCL